MQNALEDGNISFNWNNISQFRSLSIFSPFSDSILISSLTNTIVINLTDLQLFSSSPDLKEMMLLMLTPDLRIIPLSTTETSSSLGVLVLVLVLLPNPQPSPEQVIQELHSPQSPHARISKYIYFSYLSRLRGPEQSAYLFESLHWWLWGWGGWPGGEVSCTIVSSLPVPSVWLTRLARDCKCI